MDEICFSQGNCTFRRSDFLNADNLVDDVATAKGGAIVVDDEAAGPPSLVVALV